MVTVTVAIVGGIATLMRYLGEIIAWVHTTLSSSGPK